MLNTTWIKATAHTFDNGDIPLFVSGSSASSKAGWAAWNTDLTGPLRRVTVRKMLGEGAGSFQIAAKHYMVGGPHDGRPLATLIKDGDWITINAVKNGVESHLMVGRIDTVGMSVGVSGRGAIEQQVTLSGRDLTAAALDVPVYFNPYDPAHSNVAGVAMASILTTFSGRPSAVVPALLLDFLKAGGSFGQQHMVPAGVWAKETKTPWAQHIDVESYVQELRGFVHIPQVLQSPGANPVWQFARAYQNPTMNEMWLETRFQDVEAPRKGYLVFREKPFVNAADTTYSPWFDLKTHDVPYSRLTRLSLSKGRDRVNHVMVIGEMPSTMSQDAYFLFPPLVDLDSVGRYGLRRLEERTPYMALSDEGGADAFYTESLEWQALVLSWNVLNADYLSGVAGFGELAPEIRIGQKIALTGGPPTSYTPSGHTAYPEDLTFYVEGVQHSWAAGQVPQVDTQVLLSRGYAESRRVEAVVGAAQKYTNELSGASVNVGGIIEVWDDESDNLAEQMKDQGYT